MEQVEAPEDEPLDNEPVYSVNLEPQLTPLSELRAPTAVPEERVLVAAGYTYGIDGRGVRDITMLGGYTRGTNIGSFTVPLTEAQQMFRRQGIEYEDPMARQPREWETDNGRWRRYGPWLLVEGGEGVRDGPDDPFWMRTSAVAAGQMPYNSQRNEEGIYGTLRGIELNRYQMQHISTRDTGYVDRLHPIRSVRPEDERLNIYPHTTAHVAPDAGTADHVQHSHFAYNSSEIFPFPNPDYMIED